MKNINAFLIKQMTWLKVVVWLVCLTPLALLVLQGYQDQLGANPVEYVTRFTGKYALIFLCATLGITPLRQTLKLNALVRLRRLLGLFSFFYAAMHFGIWFWLDHNLELSSMFSDVVRRPFITVGFMAFVILIALALTSHRGAIGWLGRSWQRLHYAIYPAAVLVIAHYYWIKASKNNLSDVYVYGAIVVVLLGYRVVRHFTRKT